MKSVCLVVRSYNRPDYLKSTMLSLLQSDIELCSRRLIYDDCSSNQETRNILNDPQLTKAKNKEFQVIIGEKNLGCKHSYKKALENAKDCEYICVVDNDVNVKPNFIQKLYDTYEDAFNVYKHEHLLLTGFNPTNAHINCIIEKHPTFYRKETCGGINYFFHSKFKQYIQDKWSIDHDNYVQRSMKRDKYPLVCMNEGVVQHIGEIGLHSNKRRYDLDSNF